MFLSLVTLVHVICFQKVGGTFHLAVLDFSYMENVEHFFLSHTKAQTGVNNEDIKRLVKRRRNGPRLLLLYGFLYKICKI